MYLTLRCVLYFRYTYHISHIAYYFILHYVCILALYIRVQSIRLEFSKIFTTILFQQEYNAVIILCTCICIQMHNILINGCICIYILLISSFAYATIII